MTDTLLPADAIPTAPPPVHRCRSCDRPIRDPISISRETGPDCWAKDHPDSQPGPARSTAGVGDRDLIDEIGDAVTDQTDPDASRRDALTWAIIRAMQPGGLARDSVRDLDIRLGADLRPLAEALAAVSIQADSAAVLAVPPGGVKMLRETLCVAQGLVLRRAIDPRSDEHGRRLQALIDECDRHRPIDSAGTHGEGQHTATCGCEDAP